MPRHRQRKPKLKKNKTNFTPFGSKIKLPILGRTKCQLIAECGKQITTIVHIVAGKSQLLLGLADSKALSIIQTTPEGQLLVRQLTEVNKARADAEATISVNQTQGKINNNMEKMMSKYKALFQGLGRAKVEPIHIKIDRTVKPTQDKQRPTALQNKT